MKKKSPSPRPPRERAKAPPSANILAAESAAELRQRAEVRLRATPPEVSDASRQLHGMQVHQVELELQNEELLAARAALEASAAKYADFYDFAPVCYLTLTAEGAIHEANLTACTYLGVERARLLGQRFALFLTAASRPVFASFLQALLPEDGKRACEVHLPGEPPRHARLEGLAMPGSPGVEGRCRVVLIDLTELEASAEQLRAMTEAHRRNAEEKEAILNALPAQIALLGPLGRIVAVNESWGAFAMANALLSTDFFTGRNYLEVCDGATGDCSEEARAAAQGLRAVLSGEQPSFTLEYPCHSPQEQRWFRLMATPVSSARHAGAVVMHVDITERKKSEERLRESEERFRTMTNSIFQLAWIGRADGYITWYNQRWYDYTGTTPEQMEGWGWQSVLDPARLPEVLAQWTESIALGKPFETEFPLRGADGQFRLFLTRGLPFRDATGQVVQWFGTNTDVDEIRRAEAALREERARLAGLIDAAMDAIVTVDEAQTIVRVNPAAEAMFGWPAAQILGQPLARLIPARFGARHAEEVRAFGATSASSRRAGTLGAVWGLRADGQEFPVEASISQIEVGGEKFFTAILRDVTERRQTEAELKRTSEEMRALARHLEVIREEQAAHIARELHDELGQTLTILKLHVRAMQKRLEAHADEPPSFEAREAVELIEASVSSLRHLCTELRPPMLEHLGLGPALGMLAADFQTHSGITCTLEAPADFPLLDAPRQATVYRLVQELLTNVARHSRANAVRIVLRERESALELEVADNGRGIVDAEQTGTKSLGLLGMRERALAAGGTITFQGRPGEGTTALARIPLAPPAPTS